MKYEQGACRYPLHNEASLQIGHSTFRKRIATVIRVGAAKRRSAPRDSLVRKADYTAMCQTSGLSRLHP